jgi:hypothetical protein
MADLASIRIVWYDFAGVDHRRGHSWANVEVFKARATVLQAKSHANEAACPLRSAGLPR